MRQTLIIVVIFKPPPFVLYVNENYLLLLLCRIDTNAISLFIYRKIINKILFFILFFF